MSGPKKADVEAQLNVAMRYKRDCAGLISASETTTIERIIANVEKLLGSVDKIKRSIDNQLGTISNDLRDMVSDELGKLGTQRDDMTIILAQTNDFLAKAQNSMERVANISNNADRIYQDAEQEYNRVSRALRNSGSHYLNKEFEWAKDAAQLFNKANSEYLAAGRIRKEALEHAEKALRVVRNVHSSAENILQNTMNLQKEAEQRKRAQEEARRIAEQKRRGAALATERARTVLDGILDLPHDKFLPGAATNLKESFNILSKSFQEGRFDSVLQNAPEFEIKATQIAEKIGDAIRQFQQRKDNALSQIEILEATLAGIDQQLISEWSNSPEEAIKAVDVLSSALKLMDGEEFEDAGKHSQNAKDALMTALESAAQNKTAHEKREQIGQAVMQSLQELGFDVSYEPGTLKEPMRISGQTPSETGKGDFDIALPLSGEIGFEVNTPEGDTTCIAAVDGLQQTLEKQGIKWQTTDWGHAGGAVLNQKIKITEQIKRQQKINVKKSI